MVEALRAVQRRQVLWAGEVVVGADGGIGAAGRALQPRRVLAVGAGGDGLERNQLVAVEGRLHLCAVAEGVGAQGRADGRVQALEEPGRRVLQDVIGRRRGSDLRQLHQVAVQAPDAASRIAGYVTVAEVGAGGVNFLVTQVRQVCGRGGLCGTVAMSGEDVGAQDGLSSDGAGGQGGKER